MNEKDGLGARIEALSGKKRRSLRSTVKDNLSQILAARLRGVSWEEIAQQIEEELGRPVKVGTLRTFVSDIRPPTRPGSPPAQASAPAPTPMPLFPADSASSAKSTAASPFENAGANSGKSAGLVVETPGIKRPVTPGRLT